MEFNKQTVKALLGVVCGGIAFAAALLHLDVVAGAAGWLLGILSPLLLGCAIAFILNVPMRALERCLFPHVKKANKLRRPLALLLTVAAVSAVLALAGMVIVPGVRDAVASIAAQVPEAFERLQESPFWQTRSKGCLSTGPVFPRRPWGWSRTGARAF